MFFFAASVGASVFAAVLLLVAWAVALCLCVSVAAGDVDGAGTTAAFGG
jgi:hypothetical protein